MRTSDLFPDQKEIDREYSKGEAKKVAEFKEKDEWKFLLSDERGLRFLCRMLFDCGVWETSMKTSSEIYFNEGRRSVGLRILNELEKVSLEAYIKILKIKKEFENGRQ